MKTTAFLQIKNDRWLKPFLKQYWKSLLVALFLGFTTFLLAGALMFTSGYLISRAAEMPGNILLVYFPVLLVRIFGVGKPVVQYLERLSSHDWVLRITSSLRLKLYQTLEKDAIFLKRSYRTGDLLGLLAEDIGHLQNFFLRTVFPILVAWLIYVFIVIGLGFFSLWFALTMLLLLGITVFVVPLVSVLVNGARQTRRKMIKNELYSELTDNVLGVSDWVFSQRSSEYLSRYKTAERAMRELDVALNRSARRRDLLVQVFFGVIIVLIIVWSGDFFGGTHSDASNWIAAFVLGFFPLIDAFTPLSRAATDMSIYNDSIKRLNELPDKEKSIAANIPDLDGPLTIRLENVSFAYPGTEKNILRGLDLTIPQGERVAVLGRSGSGKSTLASLIRGDLQPTEGIVSINKILSDNFGDEISRYIGVIQQHTYLFNTTLLDNLRIGNRHASKEEVWDILGKVGLKDMVERLPDKLETLVDEAGLRFSGGERHRIALARVLLQEVPVIILDEPTVGLDPQTEQALLEVFFDTTKGKTLIMITHHLQGLTLMDRVIFIEDGVLRLDGSPAELEKTSEHYRRLQAFDRGVVG